jgi:hypothetical protein
LLEQFGVCQAAGGIVGAAPNITLRCCDDRFAM